MTFWQLVSDAAVSAPARVVLADGHGRSLTTLQLRGRPRLRRDGPWVE